MSGHDINIDIDLESNDIWLMKEANLYLILMCYIKIYVLLLEKELNL